MQRILYLIEWMWKESILASDRKGGYLCILDANTGQQVLLCPVGSMTAEQAEKSRRDSHERANRLWRLYNHPELSSWRQEGGLEQGVAVWSAQCIFSFSGLPGLVNEALMLFLAREFDSMASDTADLIAQASRNEPFQRMRADLWPPA